MPKRQIALRVNLYLACFWCNIIHNFIAAHPFVKGGTGFLNSTISEGTEIFQNQGRGGGGEKKRGEKEGVFEMFIGGRIAGDETLNRKQNFGTI